MSATTRERRGPGSAGPAWSLFAAMLTLSSACATLRSATPPAEERARSAQTPANQAATPAPQGRGQRVLPAQAVTGAPLDYQRTLKRIASAIEALRDRFPQLADFSARRHLHPERLVISYGYKTHASRRRGGWVAGVPNPDVDGLWLYLDFHDPGSTAQIHTQPVVPELRFGAKRVMFLILEGKQTRRVAGAIRRILRRNGVHPPR